MQLYVAALSPNFDRYVILEFSFNEGSGGPIEGLPGDVSQLYSADSGVPEWIEARK